MRAPCSANSSGPDAKCGISRAGCYRWGVLDGASIGHGQNGSARGINVTDHDEFFQKRQPAAVLKHAVLAEYSKVFASMVGSKTPGPIWIIDGYAGTGAYEGEDGTPTDQGSPLVLLNSTGTLTNRDVRTIFIEADPLLAAKLERNVAPFRKAGRQVRVLTGDVHARIDEAWGLVGGQPVVTFLDPFGVSMRRETMCDVLLNRRPGEHPSEVLLNINIEALWRIGGNLELKGNQVVPKAGQGRGVERADEFLGGPWWRTVFMEARTRSGAAAAAARAVANEYRKQVCDLTGRDSMSIEIRRRPNHEPLFLLTLFYSHPAAGYKFADAASRATAAWRKAFLLEELEQIAATEQTTLFGPEVEQDQAVDRFDSQEADLSKQWVDLICRRIVDAGEPALSVSGHLDVILGTAIGLAGDKHIRAAWDKLAAQGLVHPRDRSKRSLWKERITLTRP